MKKCSRCKVNKVLTEFNKNKSRNDGLQTFCRPCDNHRKQVYYKANKQKYISYNHKRKTMVREWWEDFKKTLSCEVCNDARWYVLDFHHLDPSKKEAGLSDIVHRRWSQDRAMKEVQKCKVLCSNCHREHHFFLSGKSPLSEFDSRTSC